MSYAIGVDSGGTHITATAYKNHFPIASTTNGPGNILIDPNQTTKNLIEAIGNLVKKILFWLL